jgi:cytochrome P450
MTPSSSTCSTSTLLSVEQTSGFGLSRDRTCPAVLDVILKFQSRIHKSCSWTRDSLFKTMDHNLHKQRRNQISTFFSKASIRTLEPLILSKIDMLCARLEQAAGSGTTVNLTYVFVALTLDVVSRICFGFSYDCLARDTFAREWYELMVKTGMASHTSRQSPLLYDLVSRFPRLGGSTYAAGSVAAIEQRRRDLQENIRMVVERHARGEKPPAHEGFTIFHKMLDADVPAEEKSIPRLVEEAHSLLGAGSMTVATTLEITVYYLLENPSLLARLLAELRGAMPDDAAAAEGAARPTAAELERLPFLTAVIHEGLRLTKGVSHRLARVSPDEDYTYHDVVIPRGVPVGMTALLTLEDPAIFPNPRSFDPDRWLPAGSAAVRRRRKALVVFGGGTRMCLGLNLAWTELYLTLAILMRRLGTRMELHDVDFQRDIEITVDGFNALPSSESRGLRIVIS